MQIIAKKMQISEKALFWPHFSPDPAATHRHKGNVS